MSAKHGRDHLRPLLGERALDLDDSRIGAVIDVLAGADVEAAAGEWGVESALLHRWVRDFFDAGAGQVTNHPMTDAGVRRDRFLAAYSHEMRTPLAAAQGWAEMLRDRVVPPDQLDHVLGRLCAALDRLADRNRDVELLASSSLGRLDIRPRPVSVTELRAGFDLDGFDVASLADTPIGGAGGEVEVLADPRYFPLVLRDLWLSAYTSPRPRSVRLEVALRDPWVEVRIVRLGEPIDIGTLQALFDPFDINDDATGVSIGLYLARALTVAHGGTIGVDQDETGAVLWVRIPSPPSG